MREFDDLVEKLNLSFKVASEPDGSYEIEQDGKTIDVSWGWGKEAFNELQRTDPNCIWTVLDCDGKLYVASGLHYVNRLYYLVTNQPYDGDPEEFIF